MSQGSLHLFKDTICDVLHSLVLDFLSLCQRLSVCHLRGIVRLWEEVEFEELIGTLAVLVHVEINRLCAIRQILVTDAHWFFVLFHCYFDNVTCY